MPTTTTRRDGDSPKPDDSESATRYDDKVAEVVAEGHTSQDGERDMKLWV
jgi:hypothetical protein